MSDREKVISAIEKAKKQSEEYAQNEIIVPFKEADMIIALLKEHEAVVPIPFFTSTGEKSNNYVICGYCKSIKAIMPKDTKQKYCHECGRPVLWEGR